MTKDALIAEFISLIDKIWQDGYMAGASDGYDDGFSDGYNECYTKEVEVI